MSHSPTSTLQHLRNLKKNIDTGNLQVHSMENGYTFSEAFTKSLHNFDLKPLHDFSQAYVLTQKRNLLKPGDVAKKHEEALDDSNLEPIPLLHHAEGQWSTYYPKEKNILISAPYQYYTMNKDGHLAFSHGELIYGSNGSSYTISRITNDTKLYSLETPGFRATDDIALATRFKPKPYVFDQNLAFSFTKDGSKVDFSFTHSDIQGSVDCKGHIDDNQLYTHPPRAEMLASVECFNEVESHWTNPSDFTFSFSHG